MIQSSGYNCKYVLSLVQQTEKSDSAYSFVHVNDLERHCHHTKELQRFVPVEVAHFD